MTSKTPPPLQAPLDRRSDAADLAPALQVSEARLAAMIESAMDGIVTVDASQRITLFNQAAERMFRCEAAMAIGQPLDRFIPARWRAQHAGHVEAFGATGITTRRMGRLGPINGLRADGEEFPIEASISQVEVEGQKFYSVILRDVTERARAEESLRENRETLAGVIDAASDAVVSADAQGRITLFNPAAERIFGRAAADMLGQPLDSLIPTPYRNRHGADLQRFAQSQVTRRSMGAGRVKGLNAQGEELELEASISHATINGRLTLTAILRDVTQRVRAETALLKYQVELSDLAQQLMTQEKVTTQRLAQALHDQLGQTLTAIRLSFDLAVAQAPNPTTPAPGMQRIGTLIDQAIREVRQVLVALRPPLLDDSGLAAALDNEIRARDRDAVNLDILLEVDADAQPVRWPADAEYAAFMVAREALANAIQHAHATLIRVLLSGSESGFRLEVVDDGQGLAPSALQPRPGHLGLVGMRERALAIGARFSVQAGEGGGTLVRLDWAAAPKEQA